VNVVSAERAEEFVEAVRREYAAATGIADAQCFVCESSDGALALLTKGGAQ
jgi:galactokinase